MPGRNFLETWMTSCGGRRDPAGLWGLGSPPALRLMVWSLAQAIHLVETQSSAASSTMGGWLLPAPQPTPHHPCALFPDQTAPPE